MTNLKDIISPFYEELQKNRYSCKTLLGVIYRKTIFIKFFWCFNAKQKTDLISLFNKFFLISDTKHSKGPEEIITRDSLNFLLGRRIHLNKK